MQPDAVELVLKQESLERFVEGIAGARRGTMMIQADLNQRLNGLIATWENEVVEFKRAGDGYSTDDIGKYFSALANEANLRCTDGGWLVFGVNNKTRRVVARTIVRNPSACNR